MKSMSFICPQRLFHKFSGLEINACAGTCLVCVTQSGSYHSRFWWPHMDSDIRWFIQTCHECQIRLIKKIHIPPTVPTLAGLFRKVYVDTMLMPKARGYRYIIHTRCSLTSFPEWTMVKNENFKSIAKFLHDNLLCRWGAIEVIVSDNAPQYIQAAEYLSEKYHIHHIKISLYNSQAQGPIE